MTLSSIELTEHSEIEHELNTAIELQSQFRHSIEQLTQAFQAYEGAPDLGPSFMRHARSALSELNINQQNCLALLKRQQQQLIHANGLSQQNQDQYLLAQNNYLLSINQFQMQLQLVQILIAMLLHSLRAQESLQKTLQKQAQQLRQLAYQLESKQTEKRQAQHKDRLEHHAHTARTTPFFPQPKPYKSSL